MQKWNDMPRNKGQLTPQHNEILGTETKSVTENEIHCVWRSNAPPTGLTISILPQYRRLQFQQPCCNNHTAQIDIKYGTR